MSEQGVQMEKIIGEAISDTIAKIHGGMALKWAVAVEVIEPDGDRGIWSFTSPNAKRWEIIGLLRDLETYQVAINVANILRDEGIGELD